MALLVLHSTACPAADCNRNGIPDEDDLDPVFALSAASSFGTGAQPCAVLGADLDADGLPDLLVLNHGSGNLSLLTHRGPRRLVQRADISVGDGPCAIVAVDLDQDGDLDIAVAGGNFPAPGWLRVLENKGSEDLASPVDLLALSSPSALVAADIDGDARADLAVADRSRDGVQIALNRGNLAFEESPFLATGRGPVALTAADLDGDQLTDLATANELSSTISFLWSLGSGAFDPAASLRVGRVPTQIVPGDFNRDGREDLAVAHRGSRDVRVLLNDGARAFRSGQVISLDDVPVDLLLADADADGSPDLAMLQNAVTPGHPVDSSFDPRGFVQVLYGRGTGSFGGKREFSIGSPATSFAAADLDADGRADILSAHENAGTASVLWSFEQDSFASAAVNPVFITSHFATGDFNRDGRLDVATRGETIIPAALFWNGGKGDFTRKTTLHYSFTNAVVAGDLDGDGDSDLVIADRPAPWDEGEPAFQPLWSSGDESFEEGEAIPGSAYNVQTVDADGDGDLDLAMVDGLELRVLWNHGGRRFEWGVAANLDDWVRDFVFGDIDHDGRPDLAVVGVPETKVEVLESGEVVQVIVKPAAITLYLKQPAGEYLAQVRLPGSLDPVHAVLEDLDGDLDMDLAAVDQGSSELLVWRNQGAQGFGERTGHPVASVPSSLTAGDLDGDGDADLVVSSSTASSVLVFLNRGDGTLQDAQGFAVDGVPGQVEVLDLDGTGRLDVIVQCEGSQDLWVLRNLTSPPRSTDCNRNGALDACDIADGRSIDSDGNGLPDECGARFRRGDANADGVTDLSDAVHVLGYLFLGAPQSLDCPASADTDADANLDLSDAVALLDYLFLSGPEPAAPFRTCGFPGAPGGLECLSQTTCD